MSGKIVDTPIDTSKWYKYLATIGGAIFVGVISYILYNQSLTNLTLMVLIIGFALFIIGIFCWKKFESAKPEKIQEKDMQNIPNAPKPYFAHRYPIQPNFTGRKEERKMLSNWLESEQYPMLAIIALGGMGKSALTWFWLQKDVLKKGKKFDGVVWWSFYDKESGFERFLDGIIYYVSNKERNPKSIKSGREKVDIAVNLLSEKQILLVLDGFERVLRAYAGLGSPYQGDKIKKDKRQDYRACIDPNIGIFLRNIVTANSKSKIIITSRLFPKELDGIAGCKRVDLKRMDKEDAVTFFHAQGVRGTRAEIQEPCELLGYHPLSLRLLSGMISQDPEKPGNINIWKECCPNPEELRGKEGHKILEIAYNALDKKKRKFVSQLAAFRSPMDFKALEIFNTFGDKKTFKKVLLELQNRGVLFFDREKQKFDLHPIVRSYCYDRLRDKEGVHSQLRDYFASVPEPEKIESIDDLQPIIELYHHTVGARRYDEACDLAYERLIPSPLYFQFGAYQTTIELFRALFPNGENKPPKLSKESDIAWTLNGLANSYSLSGQPRRAVPLFEMSNEIDEKRGNKEGVAIGLGNLAGTVQIPIGDLESAESNLRRAIDLDIEVDNKLREVEHRIIYISMLNYNGRFEDALNQFNKGLEIAKEISHTQAIGLLYRYRSLRALLMNDPKDALRCANKALEFAKKTAEEEHPFPRDFIIANWLIGASFVAMKKVTEAEAPLQFAITECRKINMIDTEADILLSIAKLRHLQKRDKESLNLATEALEIANRCGYVLQQADIHLFLGEFYKDQGDIDKAKEHAELAKLRSHQMIDVETGDYITKPEDTKWKYKPCYDKAVNFLSSL